MEYAHKLSNVQERELLKKLNGAKRIGVGSSRMVFIDPRDSRYVVKVAVGAWAFRQNKLEVKLWKTHGDNSYLARIKEYGNFCVVMERLAEVYDDDTLEMGYFDDNHPSMRPRNWLNSLVGYTSDNCQIGKTFDGRWVAYDYGFDPNVVAGRQVGFASEVAYSDWHLYLKKARELLYKKQPITRCEKWYVDF